MGGCDSVGRVEPSQGSSRGFESRHPLSNFSIDIIQLERNSE